MSCIYLSEGADVNGEHGGAALSGPREQMATIYFAASYATHRAAQLQVDLRNRKKSKAINTEAWNTNLSCIRLACVSIFKKEFKESNLRKVYLHGTSH